MKLTLAVCVASLVYIACAVPVEEATPQFIEVLGDDGQTIQVDISVQPSEAELRAARDARNVYYLYTRANPTTPQILDVNDVSTITNSNYNPSWTTIAVCHGYTQSHESTINEVIRDAFLAVGDYNVIILDWSIVATMNYVTAIATIPSVGQGLGSLLLLLSQITGARVENMHVIGFSLGGHVAGNTGRSMDGRVGRVTGLDSVSPVWALNSNRLTSTDAIYVECIHTYGNEGSTAYGDADFYVNGGGSQPGCLLSLCSHNRAWEIFAATVKYNHLIGVQCRNENEVATGTCSGTLAIMGTGALWKPITGLFYARAGARYPYL